MNNFDDNIRAPLPNKVSCLMYEDLEDLDTYIQNLESQNLDQEIKNVMIETRREFLLKHRPDLVKDSDVNKIESIINEELVERALSLSDFVKKIKEISNPELQELINTKIIDYINVSIDIIRLEYPDYEQFVEFIDSIDLDKSTYSYVKNIIKPLDENGYVIYKQTMEESKKELELRALLDKKILERKVLIDKLYFHINKIAKFDRDVGEIKLLLEQKISIWIELFVDNIELDEHEYNKINNFIKSIRLIDEDRESINNIFIKIN